MQSANWMNKLNGRFCAPKLTRMRILLAMLVAIVADWLQVFLLPFTWTFAQSGVDVVAMVLTIWLIGFHLLLLPTFALEFIPIVDVLPTWTTCVVMVIALRKREQNVAPPTTPEKPVIDI